jgi:hypothetical protein
MSVSPSLANNRDLRRWQQQIQEVQKELQPFEEHILLSFFPP